MRTTQLGTCVGVLLVVLPGTVFLAGSASVPSGDAVAWGKAHEGLRIGIYSVQPTQAGQDQREFRVVLENVGENDLVLNVGLMLGNGRSQKPEAIRLLITDPEGRLRELHPQPYIVGGRVDPMLVPLPAGASYTIRCTLAQYVLGIGKSLESAARLKPGAYRVRADYDPKRGCEFDKWDVMSLVSACHWAGTVHSRDLGFNIPPKP